MRTSSCASASSSSSRVSAEVLGDDHAVELVGVGVPPTRDHADHRHHGHAALVERAQVAVLTLDQAVGQLLDGVQDVVFGHEPDHVARDAAGGRDDPVVDPGLERCLPGQVGERGGARASGERLGHVVEGP
jgi:hypothetical protein